MYAAAVSESCLCQDDVKMRSVHCVCAHMWLRTGVVAAASRYGAVRVLVPGIFCSMVVTSDTWLIPSQSFTHDSNIVSACGSMMHCIEGWSAAAGAVCRRSTNNSGLQSYRVRGMREWVDKNRKKSAVCSA